MFICVYMFTYLYLNLLNNYKIIKIKEIITKITSGNC